MFHQAHEIGELIGIHALEDRQYISTGRGIDKKVAVFDAGSNAFEADQCTEAVCAQDILDLRVGEFGINGHGADTRELPDEGNLLLNHSTPPL